MTTNNIYKSELNSLNSITQNAMILYPKELVIATLRDFFSRDTVYHYVHDAWGYPKTLDESDQPIEAGYYDNANTRLFIGETFRFDVIYYPQIIVRHGGSTSVPVSFNRETSCIQWGQIVFEDGYGNLKVFKSPQAFILAGAWEGSLSVEVKTKDLRARDDLVDLISLLFVDIAFNDLVKSGLVVKGVSAGSTSEIDDRNDKIFSQTITLNIRSEWRRSPPIGNIIDVINTSIEFGRLPDGIIAPNLTINTERTLLDILNSL